MTVSSVRNFRIFNINIRSLRKHYDELVIYLHSLPFTYSIITLTEVWIKSGEEHRYQLPGYTMTFQPRPDNRAGGVVVYVDNRLQHTHSCYLFPTSELINIVFSLSVDNNLIQFSLFAVYRQCKFTFSQFKNDFQTILSKTNNPTIIVGDMNVCILKNSGSGKDYLGLISSFGFESLINEPTRIFNNSVSCIDHVMVRNSKNVKIESCVLELDITDHYGLEIQFKGLDKRNTDVNFYTVLNSKMLKRQLQLADWSSVFGNDNVNDSVANFYKVYRECCCASSTLKKVNSNTRKRSEWINDYVVNLINKKNKLYKIFKKDMTSIDKRSEYKNYSKHVARHIKRAKLNYFSGLIDKCNGDSKKYWDVIKKIVKSKKKTLNNIQVGSTVLNVKNNEKLIANEFNAYFTSIVPALRCAAFGYDLFDDRYDECAVHLEHLECTYEDVVNAIKLLKSKVSYGMDGISGATIKENMNIFAPLLVYIYSESLRLGVVPEEFKVASVVPIYKSGVDSDVSSYRPISVINTIAKVFETVVKNKLLNYFYERSLFSNNQFGFLKGRGTDLAIEKHISCITDAINKRKYALSVYLDFQKAFDVLDNRILVKKFQSCGIGGMALKWLTSFCHGRRQAVKVNNVLSDTLCLYYGTPQGGVLGPIMFLIYINDMLNLRLNSKVFAYADDTALVCSAYSRDSLRTSISKDLETISNWLIENKLLVNSTKSKCIVFFDCDTPKDNLRNDFNLFCHKHQCLYSCVCESFEVVSCVRYLGVYIDQHLKWDQHVNYLSAKLNRIVYGLYHMRNYIDGDHLRTLYVSWFESTMRYGLIHYGGTFPTILRRIVMCQRHALRVVFGLRRMESMSHLFTDHAILKFEEMYKYSVVMYVYKYLFQFQFRHVNRVTRNTQYMLLEIPFFIKETCRHQLCYQGPKIFNLCLQRYGNDIIFEPKPKVKMKVLAFVSNVGT